MKKVAEAKISKVLTELWQKNLPILHARLERLDQAATIAVTGKLSETSRLEALDIAHKLSGSLGMFGYQEGTEIARQMELIFKSPTPKSLTTLTMLAENLRNSLSPDL